MHVPRTTVLMPAYNAAPYIAEAIRSVLEQTLPDFELLVVNDGSLDGTERIARSFPDTRIRVLSQPNRGVAAALNTGLDEARGMYIARFDADDVCLPDRLEQQVRFLDAHPDYVITGSGADYISAQGDFLFNFRVRHQDDEGLKRDIFDFCPFIHSSVTYRKDAVLRCGKYTEDAHNMEDHLLWVNLAGEGKFYNIPKPLIRVRFNPSSVTMDEKWRGRSFRRLKRGILRKGFLTTSEGGRLKGILDRQDRPRIKEGAYHALCAKKFLFNNYQNRRARDCARMAIRLYPGRVDSYALLAASFFPKNLLEWWYKKTHG